MKRLLSLLLLLCGSAVAQSYHVYDVIWQASGKPAAHSPVRVCTANATGTPCFPLANVFSDQALTVPVAQPFFSDDLGNYDFWVASPQTYLVEYYAQGSPIPVHKILTAPTTQLGQAGQNGQDGAPGAPGYSPNQITSGCGYISVSGLTWTLASCNYIIQNAPYSSPQTTVTGPAADPSLDRFDAIVVDKTGTVSIVAGTPSANPAPPSLDISSQLMITFYRVNAGATTPNNVTVVDIYHENTEWTCTGSATVNCASTTNPFDGTKDVEWTNSTAGAFARFTIPVGTLDLGSTNTLAFEIYPKAAFAGATLTLQWFNGTTPACTPVSLADGNFNFNSSSQTYQLITIPTSLFNCNGVPVTRLQFLRAGTGSNGLYLDAIVLQGGTQNTAGNTGMVWRRAWNTAAAYKIQDTVKRNGNAYVAIADSSGNAPESNPAQWDALTDFAPAGVDGNLQIKQGFAFGSINTTWDPATQTLTFPGKIVATEIDSNATTGQGLFLDAVTSPVLSSAGGIAFESLAGVCYLSQNGGAYQTCASAFGGGVTSVSGTAPIASSGGSTPAISLNANGVTSAYLAVVNTRRVCMMQVGDGTNTVASSDYSPFKVNSCTVPYAAHIVEVNIQSDAGTPSVLLQRRRGAATVADLLSGALAAAGTTHTCALASISGTCIDGTTSSGSITLSNSALSAGDVIEVKSGTASSETSMRIAVIFTVD